MRTLPSGARSKIFFRACRFLLGSIVVLSKTEAMMSKVKVQCFSLSIDGFGAGPGQSLEHPIGVGGLEMMEWMRSTQTFQKMYGKGEGETGVNDEFARRSFVDIGAWILGRNMFGPIRGPWSNEDWKGWWAKSSAGESSCARWSTVSSSSTPKPRRNDESSNCSRMIVRNPDSSQIASPSGARSRCRSRTAARFFIVSLGGAPLAVSSWPSALPAQTPSPRAGARARPKGPRRPLRSGPDDQPERVTAATSATARCRPA